MQQITKSILMIRPLHFSMNEETAINNYFQQNDSALTKDEIIQSVQKEFDYFVYTLIGSGVNVVVIEDDEDKVTPDSVFPNNWVSFHSNGDVALFPMFAENRRLERREDVFGVLESYGFEINRIIDLSDAESEGKFLEGTGSIVLDRESGIAYCAISPRSDSELFEEFCEIFGYRPLTFRAFQTVNGERLPIYHTNVVMTIGESFAVLCADCIDDPNERLNIYNSLERSGKEIFVISEDQMGQFAGNMLQVIGRDEERFLVMSETAFMSLNANQLETIKKHTNILTVSIPTIEKLGGGSARCMMAEVFLSKEID